MYVIQSSLSNYLRKDAEAFVQERKQAKRFGSLKGAQDAIFDYWGWAGKKHMRAVRFEPNKEEDTDG